MSDAVVFYYDLGSPYAWLAAERLARVLPVPVRWQPILLGGLFRRFGTRSWADGAERAAGVAEVERRAAAYALPPVRWPDPWPSDGLLAMRVATWATRNGHGEPFARAAFRRAFVHGELPSVRANAARAAADAGLDPDAALAGAAENAVKHALREATDAAAALGVHGVPTVLVAGQPVFGDDRLAEAATLLSATAAR